MSFDIIRSRPIGSTNNSYEIRKEEEVNTIVTTKIEEVENNHPRLGGSIGHAIMKRQVLLTHVLAFGLLFITLLVPVRQAAHAQGNTSKDFIAPAVFQAAGSTADSIQSTVDAFRDALGDPNNGNNPPPLDRSGRREINWDGANSPMFGLQPFRNAVQHVPEHPRQPVYHTGDRPFAGSCIGRTSGRSCRTLQQSDLRRDLQRLQRVALVHASGQQYHRNFVLRARH